MDSVRYVRDKTVWFEQCNIGRSGSTAEHTIKVTVRGHILNKPSLTKVRRYAIGVVVYGEGGGQYGYTYMGERMTVLLVAYKNILFGVWH